MGITSTGWQEAIGRISTWVRHKYGKDAEAAVIWALSSEEKAFCRRGVLTDLIFKVIEPCRKSGRSKKAMKRMVDTYMYPSGSKQLMDNAASELEEDGFHYMSCN